MSLFQIPLKNVPQVFQLNLADKFYTVSCKWNDSQDAGWTLDFADTVTGERIVSNVPLVCGINLLSGLDYLGFGGTLYAYTDGDEFAVPTLDNLGVESSVYFVTTD